MLRRFAHRMGLAAVFACALVITANAADRKVTIVNGTKYLMMEFYASNVSTKDWEEDILGEDTLAPGEKVVIDIDDGTGHCMFDFMAVFEDGDEVIKEDVNVCKVGTFTFTE